MSEENPPEKSQSQRITDERRRHNRAIEVLTCEFAPSSSVDDEYRAHQRRLQDILGPDESGIVDGRSRFF
jgi:hypothetical protein